MGPSLNTNTPTRNCSSSSTRLNQIWLKCVENLWPQSTWATEPSELSGGILLKSTKGAQGRDSREISSSVPTSLPTLQAEAIQSAGLHFERGKPNENLGLGSPGQLAGGNEMKHNRREE